MHKRCCSERAPKQKPSHKARDPIWAKMISAEYIGATDGDAPRPMMMKSLDAERIADAGLLVTDAEFSINIRASFMLK